MNGTCVGKLNVLLPIFCMVASNERGRAFEWAVRNELLRFAESKGLEAEATAHTKERDSVEKSYFDELDSTTQKSFASGAKTFIGWVEKQGWIDGAEHLSVERVPDNIAKEQNDMTDIRLHIKHGKKTETRNISIKHRHDALCPPRLPSLPEQCGITDKEIDEAYREQYKKIWQEYYSEAKKFNPKASTHPELPQEFKVENLYKPLQENAIGFLRKHANNPSGASAFFRYLIGSKDYYVLKNAADYIEIKHFVGIKMPSSFSIEYPWNGLFTTFLMEFNNGWKVTLRVHNASSRLEKEDGSIYMTEKEDPICRNLGEVTKVMQITKE